MDLENRIEDLNRELKKGNEILADMMKKQTALREKLLRIAGAVQILSDIATEGKNNGVESV